MPRKSNFGSEIADFVKTERCWEGSWAAPSEWLHHSPWEACVIFKTWVGLEGNFLKVPFADRSRVVMYFSLSWQSPIPAAKDFLKVKSAFGERNLFRKLFHSFLRKHTGNPLEIYRDFWWKINETWSGARGRAEAPDLTGLKAPDVV